MILKLVFQQDSTSEDMLIIDSEEVIELPVDYRDGVRYNGEIVDQGENYSVIATIILSSDSNNESSVYYAEISEDDYGLYQELQQRDLPLYILFD